MKDGSQNREFPWWVYKVLWAIIALTILVLLAMVFVLAPIVELLGACQFNLDTPRPCGVLGVNFTPLVRVVSWYTIFLVISSPIWIPGIFGFLVLMLIHRLIWDRRQKETR